MDDDAEDRMVMDEAFTELNFHERVTMYDSSLTFHRELSDLRTLTPLPLLIVLDYNLPGEDGVVVLNLLQTDTLLCSIPVVMYSTGMSPALKQACLLKGAVRCCEKGSTYAEVLFFCKQLCEEASGNKA